ncbi:MAG: dienelactone hydrolase family protein [Alphaproteobacteria bacterium]|nr:dienelactone hydrolase family protein [Alphaproteobacteria bacterium]
MNDPMVNEKKVDIPLQDIPLEGNLVLPNEAKSLIIFVHGSGSSRFSPRNQFVAKILNQAGFATLLFDLLTHKEEEVDELTGDYRFNIELLADRLIKVTDWITGNPEIKKLDIGCFGASTGAAAALLAAAKRPTQIHAIVSRGGRPDLAVAGFEDIRAPILLIVGGQDYPVIQMNQAAAQRLHCVKKILIIPGATHLFEESGKLEEVSEAAVGWFQEFLS